MFPGTFAQTAPDRPAIVMWPSGETVTYAELDDRSRRLANYWAEHGLSKGDHIAIVLDNHIRYLEVVWAALRAGLYYTPVNWHLTAPEVAYIVEDCGARVVVSQRSLADRVDGLDGPERLTLDGAVDGWAEYPAIIDDLSAERPADEPEGTGMFYSSGTTGRPKGILFPLPDRLVSERSPMILPGSPWRFDEDTVYLSPAPMYHAAPVVTSTLVHRCGGTVVVMERFDAEGALAAIDHHRCNRAQFVPTMFVRMLKLPEPVRSRYDLSSLEVVGHSAAPCPIEVKRQMIEWWGPVLWEYYAGSENIGSTSIFADEWLEHPGSVGQPRFCTVHICDDDGGELPVGEVGQIWFETPGAAFEYHGDADKTASSRNEQGWFSIGDIGYLDEDGYLYLTDRKAFTIISGGVNIYPQEAEDALIMHPDVADVAVFGVPDDEFGEQVKAVVQPADGVIADDELASRLLAHCRDQLAHYKCPRSVDFDSALPRHDTGKLYKRLIRDRYWGEHDTRIV
ncbi:MAG: acyl-CoA synthetase [Acidimicrobiia bacterium]|nr:acyl-CoA synthetase [Acidimicrobiia bacterium]